MIISSKISKPNIFENYNSLNRVFLPSKNINNNDTFESNKDEIKLQQKLNEASSRSAEYQEFTKKEGLRIAKKYLIVAGVVSSVALALICSLKTGFGQREMNKLFNWVDTSQNIIAKSIRKIFSQGKLNVENIGTKAVEHMYTAVDNADGLGKNGVSGAHSISAFIKSFYKSALKDNIQITNIKMKDKKIKDGNIIIEYIEDGVKKVLETNIGKGFTKGQQRLLKNLSDPKSNNGFAIKNYTKSKFYTTYLADGTEIRNSKNNFLSIYQTLFCKKPTGQIDSITRDAFVDGIYSVKYHKLTGGASYPEKTIFMDRPMSLKEMADYIKICSSSIDKSVYREVLLGKKLYNAKDLITTVQTALRRGVLLQTEKGETLILGQRAGTMFLAYCDKTPNNSYSVKSFFPVLHGSDMHKQLMKEYFERKGKIGICDIPKIIGLKDEIDPKIYANFQNKLLKSSMKSASLFSVIETKIEFEKEQAKNRKNKDKFNTSLLKVS